MSGQDRLLQATRRSLWLVVVCVLAGVAAAGLLDAVTHPRYQANAQVLVQSYDLGAVLTNSGSVGQTVDPRQLTDDAFLAQSPDFLQQVAGVLGEPLSTWRALAKELTVTPDPTGDVLDFQATAGSKLGAVGLVNAAANHYTSYYEDALLNGNGPPASVAAGSGLTSGLLRLRVLEAISPPAQVINSAVLATKVSPKPSRDLVVGFASGLFFGLLLMAAREALDDRIRVPAQVEEAFGVAVVDLRSRRRRHPGLELGELVAALDEARAPRGGSVVAVVSPLPGDGRSLLVSELAANLAARGERVVVVDLAGAVGAPAADLPLVRALGGPAGEVDLAPLVRSAEAAVLDWARDWAEEVSVGAPRRGELAAAGTPFYDALLALPPAPAGPDSSGGEAPPEEVALVPTTAGVPVLAPQPGRRFGSVGRVLAALAGRYDWVIVDSPPWHAGVRAAAVAEACPLVLPLVRLGATTRVQLASFAEQVGEHAAAPGVVAVGAHR